MTRQLKGHGWDCSLLSMMSSVEACLLQNSSLENLPVVLRNVKAMQEFT